MHGTPSGMPHTKYNFLLMLLRILVVSDGVHLVTTNDDGDCKDSLLTAAGHLCSETYISSGEAEKKHEDFLVALSEPK